MHNLKIIKKNSNTCHINFMCYTICRGVYMKKIDKNVLKTVNNEIPEDFFECRVTKIKNIVGKVKNVTIEAVVAKKEIIEFDFGIFVYMDLKDETGEISAVLGGINNKEFKDILDDVKLGKKYRIRGTVPNDDANRLAINIIKKADFKKERSWEEKVFVENFCDILDINKSKVNFIDRGVPHQKIDVTNKYMNECLKIGKSSGINLNNIPNISYYDPNYESNNLANLILADCEHYKIKGKLNKENIGEWMENNLHRIDIWLDKSLRINTLNLLETALQYKFKPRYEGKELKIKKS